MTVDKFGVSYLNPTRSGGRTYWSIWETGPKRVFKSQDPNPYDSSELFRGNGGSFTIYGETGTDDLGNVRTGQLRMNTGTGNTPRLYNRTSNAIGYTPDLGLEEWRSFEATLYTYIPYSDIPSDYGESYSGITIGGFSNHLPDAFSPYYYGDYSSRAYYANFTWDGRAVNRKETRFPTTIIFPNQNRPFEDGGPMPTSQWVGMKFICRAYSNVRKVRMETYMDLTNGEDGGEWYKVIDNIDYDGLTSYISSMPLRKWYADLTTTTTANFSYSLPTGGSLDAIVVGGLDPPAIVDSKMRVKPETYVYWTYSSGVDTGNNGSIRFKYTPHYSDAPTAPIEMIKICNIGDDTNKLYLTHDTDGVIKLYMYNFNGVAIYNGEVIDEWLPHEGTTYYFDFTWGTDTTKNLYSVRVYVDTVQLGITKNTSFSRIRLDGVTTTTIGVTIPLGGSEASWSALSIYGVDIHQPDPMPAGMDCPDVPIGTLGQFWHGKIIAPDYYSRCYSIFFRNDGVKEQYYKWWSIREVDELYEYPLPAPQLNVNNSLEGCNIM